MATARQLEEAAEVARKAEEAETAAAAREEEARKLTEQARQDRLSANQKRAAADASHGFADNGATPRLTDSDAADVPRRETSSGGAGNHVPPPPSARSNWGPAALIAAVLLLIAIAMALFWLAQRPTGAETAANAVVTANRAEGKADKAISLGESNRAMGESNKAAIGGLTARSDKFDKDLAEAKAAAAKCDKACPAVKRTPRKVARVAGPAPERAAHVAPACITPCAPSHTDATIWLWHHYKATAESPSLCIIEAGDGVGLPPYCSGFKVVPRLANETKDHWLVRVDDGGRPGDTGKYQHPGTRRG